MSLGKNVLFYCSDNSARSLMAGEIAKTYFGRSVWVESAIEGESAAAHPWALWALRKTDTGIPLAAKPITDLPREFLDHLELVISFGAKKPPASLLGKARLIQWPVQNPAEDPEEARKEHFYNAKAQLETEVKKIGLEKGWITPGPRPLQA